MPQARHARWSIRFAAVCLIALAGSTTASAGFFVVDTGGEARTVKAQIRAAQFLHRATFGPTWEQVVELADRMRQIGERAAMNEWIDEQFAMPATFHQPVVEQMVENDGLDQYQDKAWIQRYRYHAWWDTVLRSEDQLRQRVAWALAQIVVTSDDGAGFNDRGAGRNTGTARWVGPTNYYDMLVRNSFGNYRDVLSDATYHPIMGVYLSHLRNQKSNGVRFPDENYAREIMQLFSIGLYELRMDGRLRTDANGNLIPTYDNETIRNFARVFTGLTYEPTEGGNRWWSGNDFTRPMQMYQPEHDDDPKTLLGGETIDLDDGDAEIQAAIDNIYAHDNVAPFISLRLIQRLVKSNPTRGYILRVARVFEDNGQGVRGDMKAVVRAILTDGEAFRGITLRIRRANDGVRYVVSARARGTEYGKLREPVIRYTSLLRACRAESDYAGGQMMVMPLDYQWTQEPYKQPTVFSFFLPSYQPPGELIGYQPNSRIPNGNLVAPEFQQKTAVTSNRLMNYYIWNISSRRARFTGRGELYDLECHLNFNLDEEDDMVGSREGLAAVVDRFDILHACGTVPQDYKNKLVDEVHSDTDWMLRNADFSSLYPEFRTNAALMSTVLSPFAAIEE